MIFVCAGASTALTFLKTPNGLDGTSEHWAPSAAIVSTLVFLCASILVIYKPRFGYGLGLAAGLDCAVVVHPDRVNVSPGSEFLDRPEYSGTTVPGRRRGYNIRKTKDPVNSVDHDCHCLLRTTFTSGPILRGRPVRRRTWPAFAVSFFVVVVWFAHSAMPYRVPMYSDGIPPEFRIVHVEKRGLRFHEIEVDTFRDGRVYVFRNDRRLFQYRFDTRIARSILSQSLHERARAFVRSPELLKLQTAPAKALRSWNAEGWYVVLDNLRPLASIGEYQMAPPPQVTDLFYQIEKLPASEQRVQGIQDICMGFCYEPAALQVH